MLARTFWTDLEVVLESMAHKDDTDVDEVPQLLVGRLERRQVLRAVVGVEVTRLDARKFGHVVDDLLLRRDVVVDEWR